MIWDREGNRGEELKEKTVGVIGFGNMGKAFVQRLAGFGCKVLVYDKYKDGLSNEFCSQVQMKEIFDEVDILSLHIPLTAETHNLVNTHYLNSFKKNIILINTARGEIVPLQDLVQCLKTGKVRGAALDVLENEKLNSFTQIQLESFNYLKSKTNVILTPHIAGWTFESHVKINVALVEKIKLLQRG